MRELLDADHIYAYKFAGEHFTFGWHDTYLQVLFFWLL